MRGVDALDDHQLLAVVEVFAWLREYQVQNLPSSLEYDDLKQAHKTKGGIDLCNLWGLKLQGELEERNRKRAMTSE